MTDPQLEDHVVGVELQIVELVEQRERATVQERPEDAARIQREIDALQAEMARAAEKITMPDATPPEFHGVEEAADIA
jgi:DNA-binding protein H-NS